MKTPIHPHGLSKRTILFASVNTTGFSFFAKCLTHSAKADIHSTKPLPSVTLGKGRSVNSLSAKTSLPSALYRALGKDFAESQSDTQQRKVAVTASAIVTAALPSAKVKHSTKVLALPSVVDLDTRQRWSLCRVPPARHSAKYVMFAECLSRGTR